MQPRKIRVADIERLQRTLENVPEHRVEEVTTVQAVRMLSSQIHAMQAKGYGLPAIAELLSDNGVVVTAATLKSYLSQAKMAGRRRSGGKTKPRSGAGARAEAAAPGTAPKPAVGAHAASRDAQPAARPVAKVAPPATMPASPATTMAVAKGTARPGDEGGTRRSAFVPKEDTRDI